MLFERIGYKFTTGKFNVIFYKAKEIQQNGNDLVSVRAFMQAVNELKDFQ